GDLGGGTLVGAVRGEESVHGWTALLPARQRHGRDRGPAGGVERNRAFLPALHQQQQIGGVLLGRQRLGVLQIVADVECDPGAAHGVSCWLVRVKRVTRWRMRWRASARPRRNWLNSPMRRW